MMNSPCKMFRLLLLGSFLAAPSGLVLADVAGAQTPVAEPRSLPPPGPDALSGTDRAFVQKAIEGGHKEVALAKLARTKASDVRVKAYAARLERDHEKFGRELQKWSSGTTDVPQSDDGQQGPHRPPGRGVRCCLHRRDDRRPYGGHRRVRGPGEGGSIPDLTMFVQGTLPILKRAPEAGAGSALDAREGADQLTVRHVRDVSQA